MIKHVVMWRLKDQAAGASKQENAHELKAALEALEGRIPGLAHIEVGINSAPSEAAADVVLVSAFADWASLAAYQCHPEHERVAAFVAQIRAERRVVDYEI